MTERDPSRSEDVRSSLLTSGSGGVRLTRTNSSGSLVSRSGSSRVESRPPDPPATRRSRTTDVDAGAVPGGPRAGSTGGASTAPASTRCNGGRYLGRRATDAVTADFHYYTSFVIFGAPCGWNSLHVGGPHGRADPGVRARHGAEETGGGVPARTRHPPVGTGTPTSGLRVRRRAVGGSSGTRPGPRHRLAPDHDGGVDRTPPRDDRSPREPAIGQFILFYCIPMYRTFRRSPARRSAGVAIRLANQSSRSLRDRPSSRAERRKS